MADRPDRLHCDTHVAGTVARCPFAALRNNRRLAVVGYTEAVAVVGNWGLHSKDVVVVVHREAGQQANQCRDGVEGRECDGGERCSMQIERI